MQLVLAGVNHKSAPLSVREQLTFSFADTPAFYAKLRERSLEGFLLSTCNRTEVYALAGHAESGCSALIALLAESRGLNADDLRPYFYVKSFDAAVAHLFAVASGVDSMVPGEDQILAQLRAAIETATAQDSLGPVMHRLGASALAVGKSVRAETGIGRHALSLISVSLGAATKVLGPLSERSVLVIGAGQTARLTVKHLERANASIIICNRTRANADALASESNCTVMDWSDLLRALVSADIVVSCTNASECVVQADMVRYVMTQRPERSLMFLDLAVPHDVAEEVAGLHNVELIGMNRLEALASDNRLARNAEIQRAHLLIAAAVEKFLTWWNSRQITPTISGMLDHASRVRERETERALARLGSLDESQREIVRSLGLRIISQLLHNPMRVLKTHPEGANLGWAVQQLFGLAHTESVSPLPGFHTNESAAVASENVEAVKRGRESSEKGSR